MRQEPCQVCGGHTACSSKRHLGSRSLCRRADSRGRAAQSDLCLSGTERVRTGGLGYTQLEHLRLHEKRPGPRPGDCEPEPRPSLVAAQMQAATPRFRTDRVFDALLSIAQQSGFVAVAAAGNGANNVALTPASCHPDYPASFPDAISVAASNKSDKLSCFSNAPFVIQNKIGVLAPGGQGHGVGQKDCKPTPKDCNQQPNECVDNNLISLVNPKTSQTGYAYWAGTSFAAPLVSGRPRMPPSQRGEVERRGRQSRRLGGG